MDDLQLRLEIVGIDFDALEKAFDDQFDDALDRLSEAVEKEWHQVAAAELHTTKDKFLQGLSVSREGERIVSTLTGFLPVALEEGQGAYDMKPGLLGSAATRVIPIGKNAGRTPSFKRLRPDSHGWHHPGFQAKRLHQQVQTAVQDRLLGEIYGDAVSRVRV